MGSSRGSRSRTPKAAVALASAASGMPSGLPGSASDARPSLAAGAGAHAVGFLARIGLDRPVEFHSAAARSTKPAAEAGPDLVEPLIPRGSPAPARCSCGSCCARPGGAGGWSRPPRDRRALTEARVEHLAGALDRRLAHVQRAAEVHGHVAGARREIDGLEVEARLHARRRPHQRAVASGHHAELARLGVGARHRDADGERAALVGVAAEAAVLVPGHVGDALHDADRLHQRARRARRACASRGPRPGCGRCAGSARPRAARRWPARSGRSPPCAPGARRRPAWWRTRRAGRPSRSGARPSGSRPRPPPSRPR